MKRFWALIIILVVLLLGGLFWWTNGSSAVNPSDTEERVFVVGEGQGVRDIANELKEQGLIKNTVVFFLTVRRLGLDEDIQAGDHRVSPSMTAEEVARSLTEATNDVWVTIPEGLRAKEIAEILEERVPSYDDSWAERLEENEGYLFPDTYLIPKQTDIDTVISLLRNTFDLRFQEINASNVDLSKEDIVIIASLIEREARHDEDRPLVSSVIHNRLDIGMKLDIDATLQYALGYQEDEERWWKQGLTNEDKEINSPYNTYQLAGLPPTPISNPGIEALQAAADPSSTDFLFYISDKDGVNRYARTLEEHNENIERYGL